MCYTSVLTFDKVDRCVEYSVVLSARRDKVINILALPLKIIVNFGFEREEPIKKPQEIFLINYRLVFETAIQLCFDVSKADKSI